ncbi:MAG: AAA family ATPase [Gaiellaceae bacterium]
MRDALLRAREEPSPQLVTLVGVPGIGKSRLLYELLEIVDAEPELISWRQGRSLPYGEGMSFWALAEIVKAEAGILETDTAEAAEAKLAATVAEAVPDAADADWVSRHLGTLVGLGGGEGSLGADRRAEAFAAWRRFLEALAEQRPLVLVFEDLHWADDGLLDFVDHLVDWASGVPILVVGSARPELLERRPGWGGGKSNATTLSLSRLSDDDTARLIGALLGRPVVEAEEQAELLDRVGGNPLYAEQYIQMLGERRADGELALPESIQGIVGARLDALAPQEKQLLQDAAVIGKVFWPGAVAALGDSQDRFELEERLHSLERKQFVRRERRSSVAEQTQYAFLHVLLRDVAYGQIPRTARIVKHVDAAAWIEALGRPEDHAEMLAHHYLGALELARAAHEDTAALAPRARGALRDAGDRARALSSYSAAVRFYREALALWPEDARAERADVLFRLALAAFEADEEGRDQALEEARAGLLAIGDRARAAEADALLGQFWWMTGDRDRCFDHLERANELVRDSPPSAGKARVLSQLARFRLLAGKFDVNEAREALELAEAFELDEIRAQALMTIGMGRFLSGDTKGRADVERGLEIALAGNVLPAATRGHTILASFAETDGDLRESLRLGLEVEKIGERLGSATIRWARGNTILTRLELGDWDECARAADEFLAESELRGPHYHDSGVRRARAFLRMARGDIEGALEDQAEGLSCSRVVKDPQALYPALGASAYVLADAGKIADALPVFDELLSAGADAFRYELADIIWAADLLDRRDEVRAALPASIDTPWFRAARAALDRNFVEAASIFDSMGAARSAALAHLRAAKMLAETGRRAEVDAELQQALAFFRSVGATRYIRKGEALLAASA